MGLSEFSADRTVDYRSLVQAEHRTVGVYGAGRTEDCRSLVQAEH